jgi:hypothetical protein
LTTEEKKNVIATQSGWVRKAGTADSGNDNSSADVEVLAAISGLSVSIGQATITYVDWTSSVATFDKSAGFTLSATVGYNEAVTVAGSPTLAVTNGNEGASSGRGPHSLTYASGSGTNALVFTLVIAAANAATNADDVLTVGAQNIALAGGTIVDTHAAGNSEVAITAAQGTACGSRTIVA